MIVPGIIISIIYIIGCIYNLYIIDYFTKNHVIFYSDINKNKVALLTAGSFFTSESLYKYLTENSRKL